ncbi:MAG: thiolase family protein [Candidatus Liptonbacteria bacterium]|nr:thiolase family protein [Candidatus Liptonbacteria bacterium]
MTMKPVYLGYAVRTATGEVGKKGALINIPAVDLYAAVIREVVWRSGLPGEAIDKVFMGQMYQAGCGTYPHRQAVLKAGLPISLAAESNRKECGSSMAALVNACHAIESERSGKEIIIAGGTENMAQIPWAVRPRNVQKGFSPHSMVASKADITDDAELLNLLSFDGLCDGTYTTIQCADMCAQKFGFTREQLDDYAVRSYTRAIEATKRGYFRNEILPVQGTDFETGEPMVVFEDEALVKFNEAKLRSLKPIYEKNGGVTTAGNSSRLSVGASALLVFSEEGIEKARREYGVDLIPMANIKFIDDLYHEPEWFTTIPLKLMKKSRLVFKGLRDDYLIEDNEAFTSVMLTSLKDKELNLNPNLFNVSGGAIALGHAVGSSGTRIVTTLLHGMQRLNKHFGYAVICIGGGGGIAITLERV